MLEAVMRGSQESGALFSRCDAYRYLLWRRWDDGPLISFIMLNPSTADESKLDPTVSRCAERVKRWGYPGILVANLFALRATNPRKLYDADNPVGAENDEAIDRAVRDVACVVCAWGGHGRYRGRGEKVEKAVKAAPAPAFCFGRTARGQPRHPLYLPYSHPLEPL